MKLQNRDLTSIIDNEAKEFALYTVEERAIPNMMDGFKPVQRFIIYSALQKARGDKLKFHKLAGLSGSVAELGYHHGEGSAAEAGAKMANTWNNNIPFLDGRGAFGSRLIQKAGAARYVFCRISQNFFDLYKDIEICPVHPDKEHIPPKHYLPIIPTVLLNGVRGIATGYSTNILPHSLKSVVECTKLAVDGKLNKEPEVSFPQFTGDIVPSENGVELIGKYELKGKTQLTITEIPYKWERDSYIEKVLDKLQDDGKIEYDDDSGKDAKTGEVRFTFFVKLKKEFGLITDDAEAQRQQILKEFGLVQKAPQFFTVIDENGHIKDSSDFEKSSDLIKHFVAVRKKFYDVRIEHKIKEYKDKYDLALAKATFISMVLKDELKISGRKKADVIKDIEAVDKLKGHSDKLISMNLYHITKEEAKKLVDQAKELKKEYEYWKSTTSEVEYKKDLDNIQL